MTTLLCFAVEHEAQLLQRQFRKRSDLAFLIVGMGEANAVAGLENYLARSTPPQRLLLAGYAGALVPELALGEVRWIAHLSTLPAPRALPVATLATVTQVVTTRAGRIQLHQSSGAELVDMESAGIAAVAARHGIPLGVVRVVSDTLEDDLPAGALAASFDAAHQRPTPLRLLWHLARHPKEVVPFARFVMRLNRARRSLTAALARLLK